MLLAALLLPSALAIPLPVVGGEQAEAGVWDDCAAVYWRNEVVCTGVLVAPTVVLTAAHCIGGLTKVKLATNDFTEPGEEIAIAEEIAHPQHWANYDIGVLILAEPAQTPPRMIAQGCVLDRYLYDGADVAIVGYGAIDEWGNRYTPYLMEGWTTVVDADCSDLSSGCYASISPGGELGAGGSGVDSCYGDSGGPLYLATELGDFVVGLTSRSFSWVTVPCRDGGIYVRPDAAMDWIEANAGVDLPEPSCNTPPEPTVRRIEVEAGGSATAQVDPGDPDAGDTHTCAVLEPPEHGALSVDADCLARFQADEGAAAVGPDLAVLSVTDDGEPPMSTELELPIEILEPEGCGCSQAPRLHRAWLLALLPLGVALGRRRPHPPW